MQSSEPQLEFPQKRLALAISAITLSMLLSACSSGGGGGGGGSGDDGIHESPPDAEEPVDDVSSGEVIVGIIDSGYRLSHESFDGKIIDTINLVDKSDNVSEDTEHGTAVAGVLLGTSSNSRAILGSVYDQQAGAGMAFANDLDRGVYEMASRNARVINVSYSGRLEMPADIEAIREITRSSDGLGSVYVVSAGNSGEVINTHWSISGEKDIFSHMLIAGGVNADGDLHQQSNFPGDNCSSSSCADDEYDYQDRFILAPFLSEAPYHTGDTDYAWFGGTSISAPIISGYAAEVINQWPHLTAPQVADLLLETADRTHSLYDENACGDFENSNCGYYYMGQGIADLEAAMAPRGDLMVAEGGHLSDGGSSLSSSYMSLSSAYGDSLAHQVGDIAVFDDLGRDYQYNLSEHIQKSGDYTRQRIRSMERHMSGTITSKTSSLQSASRHQASFSGSGEPLSGRFDASSGSMTLSGFYFSGDVVNPLGVRSESNFLPMMSFSGNNPMTKRLGIATGMQMKRDILDGSMAVSSSFWRGDASIEESNYKASEGDIAIHLAPSPDLSLSFGIGQLNEEGGALGAQSNGALSLSDSNKLATYKASASYQFAPGISGFADLEMASGSIDGEGMVNRFSGVLTSGVSLGLQWQGESNALALSVTQPHRIESGTLEMSVPVGRDLDGNVIRDSRQFDMSPSGRQTDIEFGYAKAMGLDTHINFNLVHSLEPGHDKYAANDTSVMMRWEKRF